MAGQVWTIWDDSDYYGPDPAGEPWIFATEEAARERLAVLVAEQRTRYPKSGFTDGDTWPYTLEAVEVPDLPGQEV